MSIEKNPFFFKNLSFSEFMVTDCFKGQSKEYWISLSKMKYKIHFALLGAWSKEKT